MSNSDSETSEVKINPLSTFSKKANKLTKKINKLYPENTQDAIYEVVGLFCSGLDYKQIKSMIKKKQLFWDHPMFDYTKLKIKEHDDYLVNPFEVASGIFTCGKCGSTKVYSFPKQMRSADESTATICRCAVCENHWVNSGA